MNTKRQSALTPSTSLLMLVSLLGLSACSTIGYRCPLDPDKKPGSPTACASMKQAIQGARAGTGGKISVILDDQGRLIPPELLENKPAVPMQGSAEPYQPPSGHPAFEQPKVYRVWASSFVDANGALHDGHTAWVTTPGRWKYGSVDAPGSVSSTDDNLMRPAIASDLPKGRIVNTDARPGAQPTVVNAPAQKEDAKKNSAAKDPNKQALKNLAAIGDTASAKRKDPFPVYKDGSGGPPPDDSSYEPQVAPAQVGVTAPAVTLNQ